MKKNMYLPIILIILKVFYLHLDCIRNDDLIFILGTYTKKGCLSFDLLVIRTF